MQRLDWTLLAIAEARGEPLTPVQLQKSLFLLGRERKKSVGRGFYKFSAYNYGPFCKVVYEDAEALAEDGLVRIDLVGGHGWSEYSATTPGLARAKKLRKEAPNDAVLYLRRVVAWARNLTFDQLVKAIYDRYPEQQENSVFHYG